MSKKLKFQKPTGMHDILPEDQRYFENVYNVCKRIVEFYGFKKIETPILEEKELFIKGTGITTDIVQKEMYNLKARGGDYLTLRPEFTPGVIRAYIEHGMQSLIQPVKLYSFGPIFRLERPQAGRYRQFYQFNIESIGEENSIADAQLIQVFYNILLELKFKKLIIKINSIGDNQCRPYYKKLLVKYCKKRQANLCVDCQRRLKENPLRILDCKKEKCQETISQAPKTIDHLCEECRSHFKLVLEFLDEVEVPYCLDPYLVRGLDYYTKTVFEIFTEKEGGNALTAGGRYDNLIKLLGGGDISAIGAAMGVERVILLMKDMNIEPPKSFEPQIFLVQLGDLAKRKSLKLLEHFRKAKIQILESFGRSSLKSQLKIADKLEVRYTLILGQKEALEEAIIIKDMKLGKQETVKIEKVVSIMKKKIKT